VSDACGAREVRHERAHLRKEDHAKSENCTPDKLDRNGNPIRRVIRSVLGSIVEDAGEEETDGDSPLVKADDCSTDPFGGALGLIHWNQSGDQSHAETGKDSTDDEERNGRCCGLESDTDGEDQTRSNDTPFAAKDISEGGGK
jgi:hypothetical protein